MMASTIYRDLRNPDGSAVEIHCQDGRFAACRVSIPAIEQHVNWIGDCLEYMRKRGRQTIG